MRVAGPFTVESLSPHRVVADGPEDLAPPTDVPVEDSGRFVTMILDNLRRAGVQNTVKGERLEFTTLDPFPGRWIQARGEYTESGQPKRVAVAIGLRVRHGGSRARARGGQGRGRAHDVGAGGEQRRARTPRSCA